MVEKFCVLQESDPNREHVVQGKMVYLSLPTEYGILYTKKELEDIYNVCKKHDLYLFIDGARLAFALPCYEQTNLKFEDIPNICDVMYIGGTKCGALFGEAVVIMNDEIKKNFRYHIKQRGAMMAKGRLLGIQFYELFKDNLYFEIGKKTVELALYVKEELKKKGVKLYIDSYTNQQFIVVSKEKYDEISKKFLLSFWGENEDGIIARVCTSWATTKETMDSFLSMF
jgi:threonine aldolase